MSRGKGEQRRVPLLVGTSLILGGWKVNAAQGVHAGSQSRHRALGPGAKRRVSVGECVPKCMQTGHTRVWPTVLYAFGCQR